MKRWCGGRAIWDNRFVSRLIRLIMGPPAAQLFDRLPFADPADLLGAGPVLILAPHPDDESLGCGGVIAGCVARGLVVHIAVLTDGANSHAGLAGWPPNRIAALRVQEMVQAAQALGVAEANLFFLALPDGESPHVGPAFHEAALRLDALIRLTGCRTVLTAWRHDPHPDHRLAALLAEELSRRVDLNVFAYPIWGWRKRYMPRHTIGWRIDISHHLPSKSQAIAAHASQTSAVQVNGPGYPVIPPNVLAFFQRDYEVLLKS